MNKKKNLNYLSLKGKNVFLTGSTGYFGSYLSIEIAKCGANVILNGRSKDKLIELNNKIKKLRLKSQISHFDINDHANLKSNVRKFKKIDVLIHNAYDSTINYSDKNLKKNNHHTNQSFMLNFFSVINLNKVFLNKMIRKKNITSSIINIGSIYGSKSPDFSVYQKNQKHNPEFYGASKAALAQLTKYYSVKYASSNVRVNTVTPGAYPNQQTQRKFPKFKKNILKKIPLGRLGKPEDIIGSILFLASDSSSYITGTNIIVDGGWSAW